MKNFLSKSGIGATLETGSQVSFIFQVSPLGKNCLPTRQNLDQPRTQQAHDATDDTRIAEH